MVENRELWSGWRTVRKLGSGSFGAVYEIEREVFGEVEKAALKEIVLPKDDSDTEELRSLGYDDASITQHYKNCLEDIVREYTLMRKLKGHSNIVDCDDLRYVPHESGFGWRILIKMELLTPLLKSLDLLKRDAEVIRLGMDLCQALITCRKRSILHRDIKPQNIFRSEDGNYKLGDFGIAKTSEKTAGGTKTGTYSYMAPEVYNNQPYGAAADIYSLGLVLYWLLNENRGPFMPLPPQMPTPSLDEQARLRRFRGEPLPPPAHGSEALKQVVLKACAFDQTLRYATPEEFYAALRAVQNGVPVQASIPTSAWVAPGQDGTVGVWQNRPPRAAETVQPDRTVGVFMQRPVPPPIQQPTVQQPTGQAPAMPHPVPRPAARPKETKKKKMWPWVAAVFLVFAAIGAVVSMQLDGATDKRKETVVATKPSYTPSTTAPSTTTAASRNVNFDGNYYVNGDEAAFLDLYYWTEPTVGGVNVYIQTVIDTDYLSSNYPGWVADISCSDSNGEHIAYTYCGAQTQERVNEPFCIFVPDTGPGGSYTWTILFYELGDQVAFADANMEFIVE